MTRSCQSALRVQLSGSAEHMPERKLCAREAVEHAPEYQAQRVRAGLECPLPGRPSQTLVAFEDWRRGDRIGRMQVDERADLLGAFPERKQRGMVEILAVGVAIDHGAAELELAHGALELVGGGLDVLHREVGKPAVAIRTSCDLGR